MTSLGAAESNEIKGSRYVYGAGWAHVDTCAALVLFFFKNSKTFLF